MKQHKRKTGSNEMTNLRRTKSWHKDEVGTQAADDLAAGKKGRRIKGEALRKAVVQRPTFPAYHGKESSLTQLAREIEIPDTLPELPGRLRDFAFRYATENRTHVDWASIFHVSPMTITAWLHRPSVMQYVVKLRWERSALMAERLNALEVKAYERLDALLDTPITEETLDGIRNTIKDILGYIRPPDVKGGGVNVYVNNQNAQHNEVQNEQSVHILKQKIKQIESLEEELDEE